MSSINFLNNSGIQSAESISEYAKQNVLMAEQLQNQKKEEINDPLNLLGAEFLTSSTTNALKSLGKKISKRTGIKAVENLGSEDLSTTLSKIGKELKDKVVKKGGRILRDKIGSKVDNLLTKGKQFTLNAINKELSDRGVNTRINEEDLNNIDNLKDFLTNKVIDYKKSAENTVTNKLQETGQKLQNTIEETKSQTGISNDLQDDLNKSLLEKYGKAKKETKQKIKKQIESNKKEAEDLGKKSLRDTGQSIDEFDKKTQKVLGDLRENKTKNLLKNKATNHYKFNDEKIENIKQQIEQDKKSEPIVEDEPNVGETEDIFRIGKKAEPFKQEDLSQLFNEFQRPIGDGSLDPIQEIRENDIRKIEQQRIKQNIKNLPKTEEDPVDFKFKRPTQSKQTIDNENYLDQLPTVEELTETPEQKILRQQREKVQRGIQEQAENDLGKRPDQLTSGIDPTTIDETAQASLGKTTGKVQAKVEPDGQVKYEKILFVDDDDEEEDDFDLSTLPPPIDDTQPKAQLFQSQELTQEPRTQLIKSQQLTAEQKIVTPETLGEQEEKSLSQKAQLVQKSETQIEPKAPPIERDLGDAEKLVGDADAIQPEDLGGDLIEGILGIASLVLPSALEKNESLTNHSPLFSSSFQAGVTG